MKKLKLGFIKPRKTNENINTDDYLVIHPLFDVHEEKIDVNSAKPLIITKSVKWLLISLRIYLIIMIGLSFYRTMVLAGIF